MIVLRSALFVVLFYLWSTFIVLAMLPLLLAPRKWVVWGLGVWGRVIILMLRAVCNVGFEIRGREHMPVGKALLAPKHQCMFDTMGLWAELPDACYVMKKELVRIPFFGWYGVKAGNIIIDRQAHAAALRQLLKDARERMGEDRQLIIFPEGTRTAAGTKGEYQPGVAALYRDLGLPCIPVATNSGVHWPPHGFLRHPGTIVYEFLPPIPPGLKRAEFMAELETRIEAASTALLTE